MLISELWSSLTSNYIMQMQYYYVFITPFSIFCARISVNSINSVNSVNSINFSKFNFLSILYFTYRLVSGELVCHHIMEEIISFPVTTTLCLQLIISSLQHNSDFVVKVFFCSSFRKRRRNILYCLIPVL